MVTSTPFFWLVDAGKSLAVGQTSASRRLRSMTSQKLRRSVRCKRDITSELRFLFSQRQRVAVIDALFGIDAAVSVSIHTVTIAHVLETSFDDTITKSEATERNQREAATRSVLWNAQTLVESVLDEDDAMKVPQPVAVRDDRGHVVEIETVVHGEGFDELRKKVGIVADPDKGVIARGLFDRQLVVDSNLSDNENLRRAVSLWFSLPHHLRVDRQEPKEQSRSNVPDRRFLGSRPELQRSRHARRSRRQSHALVQVCHPRSVGLDCRGEPTSPRPERRLVVHGSRRQLGSERHARERCRGEMDGHSEGQRVCEIARRSCRPSNRRITTPRM